MRKYSAIVVGKSELEASVLCASVLVCLEASVLCLGRVPGGSYREGGGSFTCSDTRMRMIRKRYLEDAPLLASIVGSSIRFVVFSCNFDSY